jgi:small subunit ribosomal protein S8
MVTDPIADLLTRIRNAYMARLRVVSAPHSKLKENIVKILKKNKFIVDYEVVAVEGSSVKKDIKISLPDVRQTKYIPTLKRISSPGQRIYVSSSDIRKSRNGLGIYILSTPKGIVTGYEAHALKVGGELLCEIY